MIAAASILDTEKRVLFALFFMLYTFFFSLRADVITYPAPKNTESSNQYKIEITQHGVSHEPFVYISHAQIPKFNLSKSTSFSIFSFTGKAQIKVTKLQGDFKEGKILPSNYGISTRKTENTLEFTLDKPQKIAVEFDNDISHPLLIFADEPEIDVPSPKDKNVIYFGPGIHTPSEKISPKSGQTVYLAGGAIVNAFIYGKNVSNVTVRGKGILSGRIFGHTHGRHIQFSDKSDNITVKDITIIDSPGFYVTTGGNNTHVKNIKALGWWFNTDEISTGENGLIEDCFLKCNDDAIKLYRSGTQVYRTTIWQMENGAPFQISWNMNSDNSGFLVKDCDVIHCDHHWDNTNTSVFNSIHGGSGHMHDYLFEDIRIENCDWRLLSLQIRPNQHAHADKLGKISNITFKNISIQTPDHSPLKRLSLIQGYDTESTISNVHFENLSINGEYIADASQIGHEFEPKTTSNITFNTTNKASAYPAKIKKEKNHHLEWTNPIWNTGLNSYGAKDFFIWQEENQYFLLATENPNNEWGKRGIILYASDDMINWREECYLLNRKSIDDEAWYKDGFAQPEMHKINGKYYLIFNAFNNEKNPYGRKSICIAESNNLHGPFTVINKDKGLAYGANTTLLEDDGKIYAYWDLDGRFYTAQMDMEKAQFSSEPKVFLGPEQMGNNYRFLDAPCIHKHNNRYYLISSSFYAGYIIRVRYFTAASPEGPWTLEQEPLMTWKEDEADMNVKMPWPSKTPFAPPTQVVFHHHIFKGAGKQYYIAYHSSEKYSEPYLIIEPLEFDKNGRINLPMNKKKHQYVDL